TTGASSRLIPMPLPTIVMAGTGFKAVQDFLARALPGGQLEMVAATDLLAKGFEAEVLIPAMSRIDGVMMDRIRGLRLIHQWGAGLEGVDLSAATQRRIAVANVPSTGGNAESVAEWCVMAAIAVSRRLPLAVETIRKGTGWGAPMGRALVGRTAGIVGLGGIGQALAVRLKPFGMRLAGIRQNPDPAMAARLGLEWAGGPERLPELLRWSDYLFLCIPLNQQTRTLIDERALALMPSGACIINAARGGLIDHQALLRMLSEGRLIGAGLDVFEQEPIDPSSPLLARPDVFATAHIAGVTDVSYSSIARALADNVLRLQKGEPLQNCVNSEAIA
ncbi:MAG TPA: 2-hydroxyacid dehydrogenase, partial [Candidatus Binataceae bacterium]|nr:2-hydroxyacid dehydrogenase [Candidatus Binataceae bacterium]